MDNSKVNTYMKITKKQLKQIIKEELEKVQQENIMQENLEQFQKYKAIICDKTVQKAVLKLMQSEPGSITEKMVLMMIESLAPEQAKPLLNMLIDFAGTSQGKEARKQIAAFLNSEEGNELVKMAFEASRLLCQFDIPKIPGLPFEQ